MLVNGGKTSANPLSTALIVKLSVRVTGIDEAGSFVTFSVGDDEVISLGFDEATVHFGTELDFVPSFADIFADSEEVAEMVTVCLSSGLMLLFTTFK
jgi:ethanolamine transporter EutH